jgi:hypothetical protein
MPSKPAQQFLNWNRQASGWIGSWMNVSNLSYISYVVKLMHNNSKATSLGLSTSNNCCILYPTELLPASANSKHLVGGWWNKNRINITDVRAISACIKHERNKHFIYLFDKFTLTPNNFWVTHPWYASSVSLYAFFRNGTKSSDFLPSWESSNTHLKNVWMNWRALK